MVASNDAPLGTAFTVSVDVKHGLTTGISAEERTNTVRALANHNMGSADFVRPGHVFPLIAKDGGVLMRSGHTEACVDLCKLAGLAPVGVLASSSTTTARSCAVPEVAAFADRHGLKRLSIADLIAYRQAREKLVERLGTFPVKTEWGDLTGYAYSTPFDPVQHFAFVHGRIGDGRNILVRLHRANVVADILEGGKTIAAVMRRFAEDGRGVLVYLRDGTAGVPLTSFSEGDTTTSEALRSRQWREIGLGAQILRDLGVTSIRNIAVSSRSYVGLSGFGIELLGNEPPGA